MHAEERLRILHITELTVRTGHSLPARINSDGFVRGVQPPQRSMVLWGELLVGAQRTAQGPESEKMSKTAENAVSTCSSKTFLVEIVE